MACRNFRDGFCGMVGNVCENMTEQVFSVKYLIAYQNKILPMTHFSRDVTYKHVVRSFIVNQKKNKQKTPTKTQFSIPWKCSIEKVTH